MNARAKGGRAVLLLASQRFNEAYTKLHHKSVSLHCVNVCARECSPTSLPHTSVHTHSTHILQVSHPCTSLGNCHRVK